ncbi:MAG: methyltransferase domain-containing protein, partial [Candidatus Heimdallarchaeota archaeon]
MKEQIVYYQKRAKEYELVYQKTERQSDLVLIKDYLSKQFVNKSIIEIACGTGYWTEVLSKQTKSILASDINPEVIQVASMKNYSKGNVVFEIRNFEDLKSMSGEFEGFFGGFIWSHIRKDELN